MLIIHVRCQLIKPGKIILVEIQVNKINTKFDSKVHKVTPTNGGNKLLETFLGDSQLLAIEITVEDVTTDFQNATIGNIDFAFCMEDITERSRESLSNYLTKEYSHEEQK